MPIGKLLNAGLSKAKLKAPKKSKPKKKTVVRFRHKPLRFNTKPIRLSHNSKSTKPKTKTKGKTKKKTTRKLKHKGAVGEFFQGVYKVGSGVSKARARSREVKLEESRLKALESAQIRKEAKENRLIASQQTKSPSRFNPKGKSFRKTPKVSKVKMTKTEKRLDKALREQEKLNTQIKAIEAREGTIALTKEAKRRKRQLKATLKEHKDERRKELKKRLPTFTRPPPKLLGRRKRKSTPEKATIKKPVFFKEPPTPPKNLEKKLKLSPDASKGKKPKITSTEMKGKKATDFFKAISETPVGQRVKHQRRSKTSGKRKATRKKVTKRKTSGKRKTTRKR